MKKERGEAININDSRQFYSLQRQEREECKKENDDDEHTENVGGGSNSKLSSMPFGSYICSLHSSRLQFIVVVGKGCCVACGQKRRRERVTGKRHQMTWKGREIKRKTDRNKHQGKSIQSFAVTHIFITSGCNSLFSSAGSKGIEIEQIMLVLPQGVNQSSP